jgi:hypothetical protein
MIAWPVGPHSDTPYSYWSSHFRPRICVFRYVSSCVCVYYPFFDYIAIRSVGIDKPQGYCKAYISVDETQKSIHFRKYICSDDPNFFAEVTKAIYMFFGYEYTLVKLEKMTEDFIEPYFTIMRHLGISFRVSPNGKMIGYLDHAIEDKAAIIIQAFFKGWSARIKYRFNPHNRFGKFIIYRMFQEVAST